MGELRKTYDVEFKHKAVKMFINDMMGYKTVAKALGINDNMVWRWVAHYEKEALAGLEEKRGKSVGSSKGRPKVQAMSPEQELERLRAENEYLKKLWALQRGQNDGKGPMNTSS
ncbi:MULTISPECIES: transposase [unclassified Paenibacillus]|uniref:transposase n=1 Tax=unclassified Paenibacillus TaxID=185978 RepID=UPI001AE59A85|nr:MULTISPECIES: transposase [unclassified Paenibacillus]MBP1154854.1 transposase [Paenibacillus sp. PvP091]MBP1169762.1 transposase [Paenibacillus sp. PvR098]MBP2440790.1 transposase [Paenibacillus sp. PvP052]